MYIYIYIYINNQIILINKNVQRLNSELINQHTSMHISKNLDFSKVIAQSKVKSFLTVEDRSFLIGCFCHLWLNSSPQEINQKYLIC